MVEILGAGSKGIDRKFAWRICTTRVEIDLGGAARLKSTVCAVEDFVSNEFDLRMVNCGCQHGNAESECVDCNVMLIE